MMVTLKKSAVSPDYMASGLRQQMESLSRVIEDMESETLDGDAIGWRIRAVELSLRKLREAA